MGAITMQVQRAARDHDAAVTHAGHDVFTLDVVGEGDGCIACVRTVGGTDLQFAVQHDPLGGQLQVRIVGKSEFPLDRQTAERGRADIQNDLLVLADDDLVTGGRNPAIRPGCSIRPAQHASG